MHVILRKNEYNELKSKAMNGDFLSELIKSIESFEIDYNNVRAQASFINELKSRITEHQENLAKEKV